MTQRSSLIWREFFQPVLVYTVYVQYRRHYDAILNLSPCGDLAEIIFCCKNSKLDVIVK